MTYEELLCQTEGTGLKIREHDLRSGDGRISGNRIAIRKGLNEIEKSCVLAEELGHYYTSTGNILDQSNTGNRKQEYRARLYGYNLKVGLMGIIQAYEAGCRNLHETAELLDVTEEYLIEVLDAYRRKYGCRVEFDNYVIMFEPYLAVIQRLE